MVLALTMGLHKTLLPIIQSIQQWLQVETQLLALCQGFHSLSLCFYMRSALEAQGLDELETLLMQCFERICTRIPWLNNPNETDSLEIAQALVNINALVISHSTWCQADLFFDALENQLQQGHNALIKGVCAGALYHAKRINSAQTQTLFKRAFSYATLAPEQVGHFLQGFLLLARGLLLVDNALLALLNQQLSNWDEEEFLHALPSTRLAFAQLSPRETQALAQQLQIYFKPHSNVTTSTI